ncbi:MAG: NnrU family protein [Acetobacteraceae bacterium]|nr:NnrU family protein [Acetobacteraceae bacterium]MCX7685227.1 NnrU family protein [Acetobacteraceae bacterium]MDW8399843.1 NnrU family protein [Acetobacteraceae bacterium]
MFLLVLAAILWVAVHVGIAGTVVRARLVARLGEGGFRIAYSAVSLLAIYALVAAWNAADTTPLWTAGPALRWLLALLMLPAILLFVASVAGRNPTAVGQEGALAAGPRGIFRITRHPMLWSFALWAAIHVAGNGDSAAVVFFGAFLVTALLGMPSIDAKLAARRPDAWPAFRQATSILPFGAILAGRQRLALAEIGWIVPAIALVLWAALLHVHRHVFGVSAVLL